MLLDEFNSLAEQQKAEYVWQHGQHLVSFRENESSYLLYKTTDFYVQIELNSKLEYCITAFKQGPDLERYLGRVDLTSLLNS
jgi:hypothetical protein